MFRTHVGSGMASDLVVIPKSAALQVKLAEVVSDYVTILKRLNLSK